MIKRLAGLREWRKKESARVRFKEIYPENNLFQFIHSYLMKYSYREKT